MSATNASPDDTAELHAELRRLTRILLAAVAVPCAGAILVSVGSDGSPWQDGVLWILYMGAAAALAAIVGLVFGIPRARAEYNAEQSERYSSNSNLEQISDWLTRLLVGAGLVELTSLPGLVDDASSFFGENMSVSNARAFTAAALAYGTGLGFGAGYLWTRLRFRVLLEWSDRTAAEASKVKSIAAHLRVANQGGKGPRDSDAELVKIAESAVSSARGVTTPQAGILWADDHPENNTSLVQALTQLGIGVDLALSTDEALRRLQRGGYALVITDLGRRENDAENPMAGLDLIRGMREQGFTTPVFVYAGSRAVLHRDELLEAGATLVTNRPARLFEQAVQTVTQGQ